SADMGELLVQGIRQAPVTSAFYSQVAAGMIQADQDGGGRYRAALTTGFVEHGILSPTSAAALSRPAGARRRPAAAAAAAAAADERPRNKKTHTLVASPEGGLVLKRLHFCCGCAGCRRHRR